MMKPLISVIIAARNAQGTIRACLDAVLKLDYPAFEVIVADDGSTDGTLEILRAYGAHVRVVALQHAGPSRARNEAAALAKGEFLAFTDSDCIVDAGWLNELLRCFGDVSVVAAGGLQKSPADETVFGRRVQRFFAETGFVADYARQRPGIYRAVHNPSCNSIYRAEAFRSAGGFWTGIWPGEDVELDHRLGRAGGRIMCNAAAVVCHYRQSTMSGFCRMMRRYGWAQAVLLRRHGFFRFVQCVPFLSVGMIAACAAWPLLLPLLMPAAVLFALVKRISWSTLCLLPAAWWHWHAGFAEGLFRSRVS